MYNPLEYYQNFIQEGNTGDKRNKYESKFHDHYTQQVTARLDSFKKNVSDIKILYTKYKDDLRAVLNSLRPFWHQLEAGYDNLESEILYLRIRESKPREVLEMSPNRGWASLWILHALKDNNLGELYSYDLHSLSADSITRFAPGNYDKWHLNCGDITKSENVNLEKVDFILIDSAHTEDMANWYIKNIIEPIKESGREVGFNVHDIFRYGILWDEKEAEILFDYMNNTGIDYWSVAYHNFYHIWKDLMEFRDKIGFPLNESTWSFLNPSVFFTLNKKGD